MSAYFELEDHPAAKVLYTFNLEMHKKRRTLNGIISLGVAEGYRAHRRRAKTRLKSGAA